VGSWYRQALAKALNKEIDVDSDALVWTLHTSTYAPNRDTHAYVSSLSNELGTAGGYTSGGLAAGTITVTYTAADSWGTSRANSTAYAVDDMVRPASANTFLYRCVVAGTTGGSPPTYGTVLGGSTTDGTVTWELVGSGIVVFDLADPSWAGATFGPARYAVLSDRQTGVAGTSPLIGFVDFISDRTGGGAAFGITLHATLGFLHIAIP
jgi:hypothetical protein